MITWCSQAAPFSGVLVSEDLSCVPRSTLNYIIIILAIIIVITHVKYKPHMVKGKTMGTCAHT